MVESKKRPCYSEHMVLPRHGGGWHRLQAPFRRLTLQMRRWGARRRHVCTGLLRRLVRLNILLSSPHGAELSAADSTCQALYSPCESFDQGCGQRRGIGTGVPLSLWSLSSSLPYRNCHLTVLSRWLEPCFHALRQTHIESSSMPGIVLAARDIVINKTSKFPRPVGLIVSRGNRYRQTAIQIEV